MKLPPDLVIAPEKLTHYLLVRRQRNDKSGFLARAGYDLSNWKTLEADIRDLARTTDAEPAGSNPFGDFYVVRGELRGPNATILKVRTVWIRLVERGEIRFVTLVPEEE